MKLAVGKAFPYERLKTAGVTVSLGTDGCSSNNNLDMLESMKFASLLQKYYHKDTTVLPALEAFQMATINGAKAFGLTCGEVKEGALADIALIDLQRPELTPHFDLYSDLAYSGNGGCIDTLLCDGKLLMANRRVENEETILEEARRCAFDLIRRASKSNG